MSDNKEFRQRIAEISKNAHLVTSYCSDAQFDHNGYIQDPELRITSMMEAAKADPIFEGVPESVQRSVLSAWGSAIAEYSNKHRCSPRPEVLAAAHQTLENCLLMENVQSGQKSLNDIMLESINAEVMSSQDGIIRQPIFLAMILPVALGAQTGDACTFIPVPRDKSKIYEIINVAGTTFGDFKQGDQLDMQSVGQYAQMRRNYVLAIWTMMFKGKVQQVFRDIAERTRTTGSVGMFAGADAAGFIKMLPPTMFTAAENYTQVPYVHFIGTLFNGIKVFEIPSGVCTAFTASGIEFHSYDILCYCRDENPGKAGFITGDAVPVIPFKHPTTPALVDRTTLWGSSINRIHPRNGQDYFTLFTLTSLKVGGLNFRTGGVIESASSN